jgi:hypothetical protein
MGGRATREEILAAIERQRRVKEVLKSKEPTHVVAAKLDEMGVKLYCPELPGITSKID